MQPGEKDRTREKLGETEEAGETEGGMTGGRVVGGNLVPTFETYTGLCQRRAKGSIEGMGKNERKDKSGVLDNYDREN